jgi:hypothetical protein
VEARSAGERWRLGSVEGIKWRMGVSRIVDKSARTVLGLGADEPLPLDKDEQHLWTGAWVNQSETKRKDWHFVTWAGLEEETVHETLAAFAKWLLPRTVDYDSQYYAQMKKDRGAWAAQRQGEIVAEVLAYAADWSGDCVPVLSVLVGAAAKKQTVPVDQKNQEKEAKKQPDAPAEQKVEAEAPQAAAAASASSSCPGSNAEDLLAAGETRLDQWMDSFRVAKSAGLTMLRGGSGRRRRT